MWELIAVDLRPEILLRVALTLLVGFILGAERERHGRAAGLRTTLLVCLSSCVAMIISDSFYIKSLDETGSAPAWHPDPARLAAGALTGMGFLGAGVIVRQSDHLVRGVTTAATLWFGTVIGLAFGAGAIGIGLLGSSIACVILYVLPMIEARIQDDWYSNFFVLLDPHASSVDTIIRKLTAQKIKVKGVDIQDHRQRGERRVTFHLKYKKGNLIRLPLEVTEQIGELPGV